VIYAGYLIFKKTLTRQTKDDWGRRVSEETPNMLEMDRQGMAWHEANIDKKQDVHIVNNGMNLYGEFYDFGSKNAVMILSGRTESLRYGYFFAAPYAKAGFSVLVVDPRGHGWSDGKYNTVGHEESKDQKAWARFLQETYGIENLVFHGICIGAAGGMLAITSDDCPTCVKALVTEGMFPNFWQSMRNHVIERKRLMPFVMFFIDFWFQHYTGHTMRKGPIDVIGKMDKPLLMLQSKEDPYSTAEYAQKMFDLCPSEKKTLHYFETGGHSLMRLLHTEEYDAAIAAFLQENFAVDNLVDAE
jgi:alpha-beta hydrolase superfamily lysophospholipase